MVDNTDEDTVVVTDEARACLGMSRRRITVKHSVGEYVRGQAHTNGMESFWSLLKRGFTGTYHKISPKHLHRYVDEFSGRHNDRPQDTIVQMGNIVRGEVTSVRMFAKIGAYLIWSKVARMPVPTKSISEFAAQGYTIARGPV